MNTVNGYDADAGGVQPEPTAHSTSPPLPVCSSLKRPAAAIMMLKSPAGMDRAKKILKALGTQEKYVKDHQQTPVSITTVMQTPSGNSTTKRPVIIATKKKLTPTEKAQTTIDEIEELKKTEDAVRPIVFFTEHMIHHITADPTEKRSAKQSRATNKTDENSPMHAEKHLKRSRIASLEAIQAYNNMEAEDKASDDDLRPERPSHSVATLPTFTSDTKNNTDKSRRSEKYGRSSRSSYNTESSSSRNHDSLHKRRRRHSRDERRDEKQVRRRKSSSRSSKSASKSTPKPTTSKS